MTAMFGTEDDDDDAETTEISSEPQEDVMNQPDTESTEEIAETEDSDDE